MDKEHIYNWLKLLFIVLAVVAVGTFAVNQVMNYYYKANFLNSPCQLCVKLNPDWNECYNYITRRQYIPEKLDQEINYSKLEGIFISPKS